MSIEAKHAYRFGYLKSEKWKALRLSCLSRDDAKCRACGKRDLSNDAHHIRYPKDWNDTTIWHLRTLCRPCHDKAHVLMKQHPDFSWRQLKTRIDPEEFTGRDHANIHARAARIQRSNKRQLTVFFAQVIHLLKRD